MEETISTPFPWLQDAMKKGAILGMIHIMIFLALYFLMTNKLTGFSYLLAILILNLGFSIYNGIEFRKEMGGYIDFTSVFKYIFVLLTTNGVINIVFIALFLLIEPAYPEVMAQSQLDTSVYWAQRFGAPEQAIEKIHDDFDFEEIKGRFNYSGLLFSFGIGLILYAIGALITALIVRKREPEII